MNNYKGVFYKETNEKKFYEGGAHFRYKDLYEILLFLGGVLPDKEYNINSSKDIMNITNNINISTNKRKSYSKTRNINQFNIFPNTQLTFNINSSIKNNNYTIKNLGNVKSRNNANELFFDGKFKNKTNTTIFNYNQRNNIRENLIKTFINVNKKGKENNINNEEKTNIINNDNNEYINSNSQKYIDNSNFNRDNNNKILVGKNNINQIYFNYNYNFKYSNLINNYNNNSNKLINIKKNNKSIINEKKQFTNLKDKLNIYLSKKNNGNYSRNIINKNMISYGKTFDFNKDMNYKEKNINSFFNQTNNKGINNLKNCSSGINMNNYMNKTMSRNRYICGNNLSAKNNIKINNEKFLKGSNKDLISQKYIRKKINQLFNFNQSMNKNINKKKNLSRNINNMNNNYDTQNYKYKTSTGISNNKLYY